MPLIVQSKNFSIKPEVSFKNKVYPKNYYHHNHDDI